MNKLFAHLSIRQRIMVAAVALLAGGLIYSLVRQQREADFRPLFTGVAPEDAAAIVQKLKESGVEYRLPESGATVLVPSARLAELRLSHGRGRACRRPAGSASSCSTRRTWAPPNSPSTSTTGARSKANWSAR